LAIIPSGQVSRNSIRFPVGDVELDGFFESPEDAPAKSPLMIRAYMDETGRESKDYVLVCGHGGYRSQWAMFAGQWLEALGSQRKRLHMNRLRWSSPSTRLLLSRLGVIPERCGLKRIIGGVKVSDYEGVVSGTKAEKPLKGYIVSLFSAVIPALLALPDEERLEIVFEEQQEYESWVGTALSAIATLPNPRLYTRGGKTKLARWSFIPKETTALLDQADYLCYAKLQECREEKSNKAEWSAPILGNGEYIGKILNRDEVRQSIL
jgi:hypothetical protein